MLTIVLTTIIAAASAAAIVWGMSIRATMGREGMDHGAGLMPAGGAIEAD